MTSAEGATEDAVVRIRAMDAEFMNHVAAKDAASVAELYADDARILMPGQPVISGKPEILAFYKAALAGPVQAIRLDTTHIEVSNDLAYAFGLNTVTLNVPGGTPREEKGKYVTVYRRQSTGDWKVIGDSYSSNA